MTSTFQNDSRSSFINYSISVIFLLFVFSSISANAFSPPMKSDLTYTYSHAELNDCPDLEANFGDPCDDGNAATENDEITSECICAGTYLTPANDLIENAQVLPDIETITCNGGEVYGTTLGANNELGAFECDPLSGTAPDVFYMFNSGDYMLVQPRINNTSIGNSGFNVSIREVGESGGLDTCFNNNDLLTKNTDYILRIAPSSDYEGAGEFSICFSPFHLCYDYDADPGDPCLTWYYEPGILNTDCECETPIGNCYADYNGGAVSLPNTREIWNGMSQGSIFYTFTDLIDGEQYLFECPYLWTWVTIRANNQILYEGGAPVTYTSDGTNIRVDFNGNYDCWTSASFSTYVDVQCITCNDCPDLEANFGDTCDDGNPNTIDDIIDTDCNCTGEPQTGSLTINADWDSNCNERELNVSLYAAGDNTMLYSFETIIDTNGDFVLGNGIAVGNYDIYIKMAGYLAKGFYNESITVGSNSVLIGTLKPGDLNNDNLVNILDLTALNMSYGLSESDSNFNYLADLNCDGGVNIIDVSTQMIAFGEMGAQP